jgi:hypothetical protein
MKKLRIFLIAILALMLSGISYADYKPRGAEVHIHAAQLGMGGLTTMVSRNAHTLIYNPGMLTRQKFAIELPTLPLGVNSDLQELVDFIGDHEDDFNHFDSLTAEEQSLFMKDSESFDNKWFPLSIAPFTGISFKNFGLAAYGTINGGLKIDQGVFVPAVGLRGYADLVFAAGLARNFEFSGKEVGIGVTVRMIQRGYLENKRIGVDKVAKFADVAQEMADQVTEDLVSGFGIDVGAIHTIEMSGENYLDVGVAIQDLYGAIDGEYVGANLKFGGMYHMPFEDNILVKRWDFGIEMVDAFNREGVSLFQKINMGTELSVIGGLLSLRGGFHQGYPTMGLGVSLAFIKVDIAKYTRELGRAPGQDGEDMFFAQFSIGF